MEQRSAEPMLVTYLHSKGSKMGMPISGNFELTPRCNFNCPMCYVHKKGNDKSVLDGELTAEQWIDIARQATDKGMIFVLLTGGEPFLRKDFFQIYDALKKMGLFISINSNGSMIKGEILERLLTDPPFRMNITLYGGCNETYKNMCGASAFDSVIENIRTLSKAGVDVRLNSSITQHNIADMQKIYELSEELGIFVKASSYMYPPVRIKDGSFGVNERLDPVTAAECMVKWDLLRFDEETFAKRAESLIHLHKLDDAGCAGDVDAKMGCRAGRSSFWLTWDGKMQACGMMPVPVAYPLQIGFNEAWEYIKEQTKQITIPQKCAACPKKEACFSCAAVCYTETGAFDRVPEYACAMTQATVELTQKAYTERRRKGAKDTDED